MWSSTYGPPGKWRSLSRSIAQALCPETSSSQPLLHGLSSEPVRYRLRAKLQEDAFPAVLDGRKPGRLQGDVGALDLGLVFPVHVRHDRFQPRESRRGPALPAAGGPGSPPRRHRIVSSGARAGSGRRRAWKSGSTGTSSPKPSGAASNASSSTCLIGRSPATPPEFRDRDRLQHLLVGEWREPARHLGMSFHESELACVLDNLKVAPKLPHRLLDLAGSFRQGEDAHHLRKPGVRCGADQEAGSPRRTLPSHVGRARVSVPGKPLAGTSPHACAAICRTRSARSAPRDRHSCRVRRATALCGTDRSRRGRTSTSRCRRRGPSGRRGQSGLPPPASCRSGRWKGRCAEPVAASGCSNLPRG